ncbi:MAG: hypothetical protein ACO1SV_14855 [Fimbriimonas sp.]
MKRTMRGSMWGAAALLLAGCGGSGGGGGAKQTEFELPIVWAARMRSVVGPASASSATITLEGAGRGGRDVLALTNREDRLAAHTTIAKSVTETTPGLYPLTVRFTTGENGTGDEVATATATVRLKEDGSLVNPDGSDVSVTNVSNIATVEIEPDQKVPLLQTVPLRVNARDAEGRILAIPDGAINLAMDFGGAAQVVDGMLKGVSPGQVFVTATVDGKASESTLVVVERTPAVVQRVQMPASSLDFVALTGRLYAGQGQPVFGYGQEVLTVNPTNGAVGLRIPLESNVAIVKTSADGTTAYAVTDGSTTLRVLNLQTGAAIRTFTLGEAGQDPLPVIGAIAVSPTDPTMVAVTNYNGGLALFRNGTRLPTPTTAEDIRGPLTFNEDGTAVFGTREGTVVRAETTTSGIGAITSTAATGNPIAAKGNRLFLDSGQILSANGLADLGTLQFDAGVPRAALAVSPSGNRVFVLTGTSLLDSPPSTVQVFDVQTRVKVEEYGLGVIGPWFNFVATGERSVALTTASTRFTEPGLVLAKF